MAAMTGLRQGELLGLRWMDVDAGARKVRVRQAYVRGEFKAPKSVRGARGVPLAAEIGMALESLRAQSAYAFEGDLVFGHPQTGEPLDRAYVRKRFQRACRRAGVRTIRFHDLRHTSGTRVAASGEVSLRTLQEWMGHLDPRTTLISADYQPGAHGAGARLRQKDEFRSLGPSRSRRPSRSSSNTRGAAESGRTRFGERPCRPFRG